MNIYLLRPRMDLPDNKEENPWKPWYNKAFGFVIKAKNEEIARKIAQENSGDETTKHKGEQNFSYDNPVWTEEKYATCIPIEEYDGKLPVIMRDYARA